MILLTSILIGKGSKTGSGGIPLPTTKFDAPTSFITDDINSRFFITPIAGYPSASGYEYRLNGGTITPLTAMPQVIPRGNYGIGAVQVRKKAGSSLASDWVSNTVAFTATPGSNTGKPLLSLLGDSLTNLIGPEVSALMDADTYDFGRYWGHAGYNTQQVEPLYKEELWSTIDYSRSVNLYFINLGTNNFGNTPGPTNAQDLQDFYIAASTYIHNVLGGQVIWVLCGNNQANTSQHNLWTTWIRANYATYSDGPLVDIRANSHLGLGGNGYDTNYFTDGTHYTTLGSQLAAQLYLDAADVLIQKVAILPDTPTINVQNNNTKLFGIDLEPNLTLSDYQTTLDYGRTVTDADTNPYPVPYGRLAGFVGWRVRRIGDNPASAWAFNSIPFTGVGPTTEYVYTHGDPRWNMGAWNGAASPHWYYIGSTGFRAGINFTKGVKLRSNTDDSTTFIGATIEIFIDNVSQGQVTITSNDQLLFNYQPGTSSTKLFEVEWVSGSYFVMQGVTLTN